jgi:hypothetical protein
LNFFFQEPRSGWADLSFRYKCKLV